MIYFDLINIILSCTKHFVSFVSRIPFIKYCLIPFNTFDSNKIKLILQSTSIWTFTGSIQEDFECLKIMDRVLYELTIDPGDSTPELEELLEDNYECYQVLMRIAEENDGVSLSGFQTTFHLTNSKYMNWLYDLEDLDDIRSLRMLCVPCQLPKRGPGGQRIILPEYESMEELMSSDPYFIAKYKKDEVHHQISVFPDEFIPDGYNGKNYHEMERMMNTSISNYNGFFGYNFNFYSIDVLIFGFEYHPAWSINERFFMEYFKLWGAGNSRLFFFFDYDGGFLSIIFLCPYFIYTVFLLYIIMYIIMSRRDKTNISFIKVVLKIIIFFFILYSLFMIKLVPLNPQTFLLFSDLLYFSRPLLIIKIFMSILSACYFISLHDGMDRDNLVASETLIIMLLCIQGSYLLVSSNDYFILYLAIELQSLSLYILAASKRYSNLSIEAGLKYFILGSFSSGLVLYGITLIYGFFGSTGFRDVMLLTLSDYYLNSIDLPKSWFIGSLLILAGFLFKLGLSPFHYWVADVYEGSSLIITYFFNIFPKISIFFIFTRTFSSLFHPWLTTELHTLFIPICLFSASLSILIGSIGALYQTKIKRLLAYSAIANAGYLLLGLSSSTYLGIISATYYLIIYIFISMNIFTLLLAIKRYSRMELKNITEFISVTYVNPTLAILLVFVIFSLSGIPPLIGFFGKLLVFLATIFKGYYFIAFYAMLFSTLISVYYIRLIRFLWFTEMFKYPIIWLWSILDTQSLFLTLITTFHIILYFIQGPLLMQLHQFVFFHLVSIYIF